MEQKGITPEELKDQLREIARKNLAEMPVNGDDDRAKLERMLGEMTIRAAEHLKQFEEKKGEGDFGAAWAYTYMVEFGLLLLGE